MVHPVLLSQNPTHRPLGTTFLLCHAAAEGERTLSITNSPDMDIFLSWGQSPGDLISSVKVHLSAGFK